MNINIPPDSRAWLFGVPVDHCALWSLGRWRPKCEIGDPIHFRFDGQLVARARVDEICPPGTHDTISHHGLRDLRGWKVIWSQMSFEDLRGKPAVVEQIEKDLKYRKWCRKNDALFTEGR